MKRPNFAIMLMLLFFAAACESGGSEATSTSAQSPSSTNLSPSQSDIVLADGLTVPKASIPFLFFRSGQYCGSNDVNSGITSVDFCNTAYFNLQLYSFQSNFEDGLNKFFKEISEFCSGSQDPNGSSVSAKQVLCNDIDILLLRPDEAKQKYIEKCSGPATPSRESISQTELSHQIYCDGLDVKTIQNTDEAKQKYKERCPESTTAGTGTGSQLSMINQMYCGNLQVLIVQLSSGK